MIEPIKYVTVLDFEQGEVCQYPKKKKNRTFIP